MCKNYATESPKAIQEKSLDLPHILASVPNENEFSAVTFLDLQFSETTEAVIWLFAAVSARPGTRFVTFPIVKFE